MYDIPFGKREPRTFTAPPPSEPKVFRTLGYSSPINPQAFNHRLTQSGLARPIGLKTNAKRVDSRLSQLERNKNNAFNEHGSRLGSSLTFTCKSTVATRHGYLPIAENTFFISKPAEDSGQLPDPSELYTTSYLNDDIPKESKRVKYATIQRHVEEKRKNMKEKELAAEENQKIYEMKDTWKREKMIENEKVYMESLKKRERLEKLKYHTFE